MGTVFMSLMNAMRSWMNLFASLCQDKEPFLIRLGYYMFLKLDMDLVAALLVLVINLVATSILIAFEKAWYCCSCAPHTCWLLNSKAAKASLTGKAFAPSDALPQTPSAVPADRSLEIRERS